jgi:hypothetical protein
MNQHATQPRCGRTTASYVPGFTSDQGRTMKRAFRLLCVALLVLAITSQAAPAQGRPQDRQARARVAAWVALTTQPIREGESFVIKRAVGPGRDDILLLGAGADASQLSSAVRALLTSRSVGGDTATHPGTFRMRTHQRSISNAAPFPWAGRVISDVRQAPLRELPGVGRVRAVRIWLPAVQRPQGRPQR